MAHYTHSKVKRNGYQYIKDNGDLVVILKGPLKADNWATTQSKILAQSAIATGDMFLTDVGDDLQFTSNPKSGVDPDLSAVNTDDIAAAILDTVNQEVLIVQDIVDKDILNADGDTITIPGLSVFSRELSLI
ncbi:hypothetical protein [Catenovulum sediminis]|uniref:hypothetical protein n=1 Tax=Catenovulum sediminis TaxID=1740262 RepID=UPI00117E14CA|nr:hypothetical protein [Catenovulum sediminis]